jgi:hypothetical protein
VSALNWNALELAARLAPLQAPPRPSAAAADVDLRWAYRQAAAVLSYFDPASLKPYGAVVPAVGAAALLADDVPAEQRQDGRWILAVKVRREALKRLGGRPAMARALQLNPPAGSELHQQALSAFIAGTPPPLDGAGVDELRSMVTVVGWLRDVLPDLPSLVDLRHRLKQVELLVPFRQLCGKDRFFGRGVALAAIDRYLSGTATSLYAEPPLFIHGPEGIGKSTLLAHTILANVPAGAPAKRAFVHVDFDRFDAAGDAPTVMIEAAMQLASQDADPEGAWSQFTTLWRDRQVQTPRDRGELLGQFFANLRSGALLLSLDSFSESRLQPAHGVDALWRLLNELQALHPPLRVMIAGRELPATFPVQPLALGGLDPSAAADLLQTLGIDDPKDAQAIASNVNANPRRMSLVAAIIEREGRGALDLSRPKNFLQGTLYQRHLQQIPDVQLGRLARFSFLLRRLTRSLLKEVLAGPCEVEIPSDEIADRFFENLRRELIYARDGRDGSLWHEPDVRRLHLRFAQKEDPERVKKIQALAVAYHAGGGGDDDDRRAEMLYYRLAAGEASPPAPGPAETYASLRDAIADLPAPGQAFLARLLGIPLPPKDEAPMQLVEAADTRPPGHPFFDVDEYPWSRSDAYELFEALVRTISDPKAIELHYQRAYAKARDNPLNLSKGTKFVWKEALDNLALVRRLRSLLDLLVEDKSVVALRPYIDAVRDAKPATASQDATVPQRTAGPP